MVRPPPPPPPLPPPTLPPDLFAIIKATEKLERAYVRDDVSASDYEGACEKLIAQFKVLWGSMRDAVPSIEAFMQQYHMQCPMAYNRLVKVCRVRARMQPLCGHLRRAGGM